MLLLENMKTFIELFNNILTVDEETSRQAAREIRKLIYSSRDGGKYKDIASIIENALGALTYHIRFPGEKSSLHKFSSKQADQIIFGLRTNLNNLMASSWKNSYKKFKYIDRLPSGTYKSIQLILSVLDDYCSEVNDNQGQVETKEQILERRKEIEQELEEMLKETGSDFSLDHVRDAIFHEK